MSGLFKPSKVTSTQTGSQQTSGTQTGNLTPEQQQLFSQLGSQLMQSLGLGPQVSQAEKNAARTGINNTWDASQKSLESNLASRGFGSNGSMGGSGVAGQGFKGLTIARNQQFGQSDAALQQQANERYQQMIADALGYTRPFSFSTTGNATSTGSMTQPGPSVFDRILNYGMGGLGLATGLGWNPFGGGGGSGGGGGAPYSAPATSGGYSSWHL